MEIKQLYQRAVVDGYFFGGRVGGNHFLARLSVTADGTKETEPCSRASQGPGPLAVRPGNHLPPTFRPILCCCSLQFTLQSLVTSPLSALLASLLGTRRIEKQWQEKEGRMEGSGQQLVPSILWSWPGPPVSTWSMPFHFQASGQTHKLFQNLLQG